MNRFTDSPYFLIKDFFTALVAPPNPEYLQPDITNHWKKVLFTDVIIVGGQLNTEVSSAYVDTMGRYPSFDPSTDQSQVFTSSEVAWNGWYDRSTTASYSLENVDINGDPTSTGVMMRNGDYTGELVIDGGAYIDLYAKMDDYGFVPVKFQPISLPPLDKKYFKFVSMTDLELNYDGSTLIYDSDVLADEPYYDGSRVSIQTYDYTYNTGYIKWGNLTLDEIVSNGTEMYFRKDGSFHQWLDEFAPNYYKNEFDVNYNIRNFVNTDKLFIYFGDVFKSARRTVDDPEAYHIVFNGLKDWVQSAIPSNNRTENFVEFTDTYFDQVYSEGYQLLKNVWTLRDGWECDRRFLGYIPTFYGIDRYDDVPEWQTESFREYSSELIWLMKRKGTYASAQIVYELFCNNSKNIFSIIERWHVDQDSGIEGDDGGIVFDDETFTIHDNYPSIVDGYNDYIYTGLYGKPTPDGFPGSGAYWYSQFQTPTEFPQGYLKTGTTNDTDNMVLSPLYRFDLDLSVEPVTTFQIIPEQITRKLYQNWEMLRPINRQAAYNLVYAPYTDLTGTEYSLYQPPYSGQSVSKSLDNLSFDADNYIHIQRTELGTWVITHTLGTMDVIITAYSGDFEKQEPAQITVIDELRVVVEWSYPATGLVIISKASSPLTSYDPVSWRIRHGLNRREILYQIRNVDNVVYVPENAYIGDLNTIYAVNAIEPDSQVFIKSGLTVGDNCDSDGDGNDDITITQDIWVFDTVTDIIVDDCGAEIVDDLGGGLGGDEFVDPAPAKQVSVYTYTDPTTEITDDWYAWVIDHPNYENVYQVLCYDVNNVQMAPHNVLLNELDPLGYPQLVVLWSKVEDCVDPVDYLGFAAIDNVGDLVSFFGTVPRDAEGNLMTLEWRLTLETDNDVYTFLPEGNSDAELLFAGVQKDVHYYDYQTPLEKPYVFGTTDYMGEDKYWYYYTFVVRDDALNQLNIRDYKITAIELYNQRIRRLSKQRVVYNRLSGIFKPQGVNFVCHFRIYKDLAGLGAVLMDHEGDALLDTIEEYLYG